MPKWDDADIIKLKNLVKSNLSATEIGEKLNTTKNAIIGKCSRLGLKLSGSRNRHKQSATKSKRLKKRLHLQPSVKTESVKTESVKTESVKVKIRKFLTITNPKNSNDMTKNMIDFYKRVGVPPIPDNNHCHHITGDDIKNGNHVWCNRLVQKGSVYCEHHHEQAYVTSSYKNKPQNYTKTHSTIIR